MDMSEPTNESEGDRKYWIIHSRSPPKTGNRVECGYEFVNAIKGHQWAYNLCVTSPGDQNRDESVGTICPVIR